MTREAILRTSLPAAGSIVKKRRQGAFWIFDFGFSIRGRDQQDARGSPVQNPKCGGALPPSERARQFKIQNRHAECIYDARSRQKQPGTGAGRGGGRSAVCNGAGACLLRPRVKAVVVLLAGVTSMVGCDHVFPVVATFRGDANANVVADAAVRGAIEVKLPSAVDPGEMTSTVVRPGQQASDSVRGLRSSTSTGLCSTRTSAVSTRWRQPAGGVSRQARRRCGRSAGRRRFAADQQSGRQCDHL